MPTIYFDNAATTAVDPDVLEAMLPYMTGLFGNASAGHAKGREAKFALEQARKKVAKLLGVTPGEIIFTSGGTESNNLAIYAAIKSLHCTHLITSRIEHHAVLNTIKHYAQPFVSSSFVALDEDGNVDLGSLGSLLRTTNQKSLVSLMHANNEIGTITNLDEVSAICAKYKAVLHSDCVQTIGHYPADFNRTPVHFASASAHKFHGPKGVGILYVNKDCKIKSLLHGGGQEYGLRPGTENVAGAVGFAKALELACTDIDHIRGLKQYMLNKLSEIEGVTFNSDMTGLYTVLNVSFPEGLEQLLFELDLKGICASGGSACSTGHTSHVIEQLPKAKGRVNIRFSFSKFNNLAEVIQVTDTIKTIIKQTTRQLTA